MNPTAPKTEYESFDTAEYLKEYYLEIGPENKFLLECSAKVFNDIPDNSVDILEVGGGPTVYQIVSSSRAAKTIHFTDYSQNNLDEVKKWLEGGGFDWDKYIRMALESEGVDVNDEAIQSRKATIRSKVTKLSRYDVINNTLLDTGVTEYDLVSNVFSTDAITHSVDAWKDVLTNLSKLIKNHGRLILVGVTGSNAWMMGSQSFKATNLSDDIVKLTLDELGFDIKLYDTIPAETDSHGYKAVFYLSAQKRD